MEKTLKLYYTSDTHGRLFPEDATNGACLTQAFAEYSKDENTLVLDGGDTLQGSPLLRYLWKKEQCGEVVAQVMNSAKMDYYTLGNHDFNYGYQGLASYVRNMDAVCVTANVKDLGTENGDFPPLDIRPYVIHTLGNGLRIGVVGVVTSNVNLWEAEENLRGLSVTDAFSEAKNALEAVNSVENGVDYTICIYHGGFEKDLETGALLEITSENIACKICRELEFDLVLTAHQHMEQLLQMVDGTPALQLPANAEKYAALEIAVGQTREAHRILCAQHVAPTASPDAALLETLQSVRDGAKAWLAQSAGSLSTAALPVVEKITLAIEASPVVHLANFAQLKASGAEVAITSLPNVPVGLPQQLTIGDVLTAYPFPNEVVTLELTGKILAQGIMRSASYIAQDASGAFCVAQHFMKPKEEHYNYDFFAGVQYSIAFRNGCAPFIHDIMVNGEPIDLERSYKVVMSDYRATGTGGYPFYATCKRLATYPRDLQALILETLAEHPALEIPVLSSVTIG